MTPDIDSSTRGVASLAVISCSECFLAFHRLNWIRPIAPLDNYDKQRLKTGRLLLL